MGHILHDWNLDEKKMLLRKAYDALPAKGALIVYEALIDDERRENAFGLLMSLNMLIETPGGFDYTGADCSRGCVKPVSARRASNISSGLTRWSSGSSDDSLGARERWSRGFRSQSAGVARAGPGSLPASSCDNRSQLLCSVAHLLPRQNR